MKIVQLHIAHTLYIFLQFGITSDGFFELEDLPKKAVVVGAGYIAVEMAGIFNALGCETHLVIRR